MDALEVLLASGGLCQCTGQCGHTHAWNGKVAKRRCRAPHGCTIVRSKEYPSFWQLAASDTIPLEHAEFYNVDKPVLVELKPVMLPSGVFAMCQRCKLIIERGPGAAADG